MTKNKLGIQAQATVKIVQDLNLTLVHIFVILVLVKNKNIIIGISILAIILLAGGGFFFLNKSKPKPQPAKTADQETGMVQTLSAKDVGLILEINPDNKKVQFKIAKLTDAKTISYEITYEADSTVAEKSEGADARVPRGITGEETVKGSSYASPWLDLGSCSRNVCRYDTGIESIDIILKIIGKNGKVYQVEDKLIL